MQVATVTQHELTPAALAKALASSDPSEFAAFWFAFADACKPEQLEAFAEAMAPVSGSKRKQPLMELCRLMQYHEMRTQREKA